MFDPDREQRARLYDEWDQKVGAFARDWLQRAKDSGQGVFLDEAEVAAEDAVNDAYEEGRIKSSNLAVAVRIRFAKKVLSWLKRRRVA